MDPSANGGDGSYESTPSTLVAGTRYYIRAYIINELGTALSAEHDFTATSTPILGAFVLGNISNIMTTTADASVTVTNIGGATSITYGHVWSENMIADGTDPNTITTKTASTSMTPVSGRTISIMNLDANTRYYIRAYARNATGASLSTEQHEFTTDIGTPALAPFTRSHITDIGLTAAMASSTVTEDGGDNDITYGHVWSTDMIDTTGLNLDTVPTDTSMTGPTFKTATTGMAPASAYTSPLADLAPGTMYYIRAYVANNANGGQTVLSMEQVSFMTPEDTDGDGVSDTLDVDDDNDGLIEIRSLDMLDHMRHNLAGTSYRTREMGANNTNGAPTSSTANCTTGTDVDNDPTTSLTYLCGYELAQSLDFSAAASYATGSVDYCLRPLDTTGATRCALLEGPRPNSTHVVDASSGQNPGWAPILSFAAIFDGNDRTIRNLYIRATFRATGSIGLFGSITSARGRLRNIGLVDLSVRGGSVVGGLVGNAGADTTITSSYATGSVSGTGNNVGGLVGQNSGNISSSYAAGSVMGDGSYVGGLVGAAFVTTNITSSYATGSVSGADNNVGGLVGGVVAGTTTITSSYATGPVSGTGDNVGGLVGNADANTTITSSYTTGSVMGDGNNVGGLVGGVAAGTTAIITSSYATGSVSGTGSVGGLVGGVAGASRGNISSSYATGSVSGDGNWVGGLVGVSRGNISSSYATGSVSGDGNRVGGLIGLSNRGNISSSYATGSVEGTNNVGGLIGSINVNSNISSSYATGSVSGTNNVGDLIGLNDGGNISHSCGGPNLMSELQTASTDSAFTYMAADQITCNAAGNNSAPVSGIRLFYEWDHHYYRRTGAGTSESPHAYTLVTEGASGCDASVDGGTVCDGANYPAPGTHDRALWDFGSATASTHNSLPALRSPTSSGAPASDSTHALDPHLQWAQHFVAGWQLQDSTTPVSASTSFTANETLTLPHAQGAISSANAMSSFFYDGDDTGMAHDGYTITVNWDSITGDAAQSSSYVAPSNDMAGFLRYNALADTPGTTSLVIETAPMPALPLDEHTVFVRAILSLMRGSGDSAAMHSYNRDFGFVVDTGP